jgi:hypothetical protein
VSRVNSAACHCQSCLCVPLALPVLDRSEEREPAANRSNGPSGPRSNLSSSGFGWKINLQTKSRQASFPNQPSQHSSQIISIIPRKSAELGRDAFCPKLFLAVRGN